MLPQRRKTAEEIAKLRETMGIPVAPGEVLPAENAPAPPLPEPEAEEDLPPPPEPKPVRSLRKSEQQPVEYKPVARKIAPAAEEASPLPLHRHSDRELMELRRIQATPPDKAIAYIHHLAAPWPLVALGYLLPLTGAFLGWFAAWSPHVPEPAFPADWIVDLSRAPWLSKGGFLALAACCALGLALAGWIAWKKPRSRHHSGFITIIAILVAVFGIIHQFSSNGP